MHFEMMRQFLSDLGHIKICIQTDGESSLINLMKEAQERSLRGGEGVTKQVRVRSTAGYTSSSNGLAERSHAWIKGGFRTWMF